jgi:hypothetical protein
MRIDKAEFAICNVMGIVVARFTGATDPLQW